MLSKRAYPSTVFPTYGLKVDSDTFKKKLGANIEIAVANTVESFLAVDTRTDALEDAKSAISKSTDDILKAILK
jgi:hypothetical protein